jgi:hypothetical protein
MVKRVLQPAKRIRGTVAVVVSAMCLIAGTTANAQTQDAAVSFVRQQAASLAAMDSDQAIRQWVVERDRSALTLHKQIEAVITSRYPSAMRDAKLREALASEYEPFVDSKVVEIRNQREDFKCRPVSLFLPGSKLTTVESGTPEMLEQLWRGVNFQRLGATAGTAVIVFADIEYPDSAVKISNRASSLPSELQHTDPVFKEFAPWGWYWLRKTVARFVVTFREDPTFTDIAIGLTSGVSIERCDLVDVQVYGRAPTPSAYVRYGKVSQSTDINLRFLKPVSSETAVVGDALQLEVSESLTDVDMIQRSVDGGLVKVADPLHVIIAAGAAVKATVIAVQKPGRGGRPGAIAFQIDAIPTAAGDSLPINQKFEKTGNPSDTAQELGVAGLLVRGKHAVIPAGARFALRVKEDYKVRLPER